jgi:hypothetical protein
MTGMAAVCRLPVGAVALRQVGLVPDAGVMGGMSLATSGVRRRGPLIQFPGARGSTGVVVGGVVGDVGG